MSMTPDSNGPLAGSSRDPKSAPAEGVPTIRSDLLLGRGRQLRIEHADEWYVLRQTTNNKLILTK